MAAGVTWKQVISMKLGPFIIGLMSIVDPTGRATRTLTIPGEARHNSSRASSHMREAYSGKGSPTNAPFSLDSHPDIEELREIARRITPKGASKRPKGQKNQIPRKSLMRLWPLVTYNILYLFQIAASIFVIKSNDLNGESFAFMIAIAILSGAWLLNSWIQAARYLSITRRKQTRTTRSERVGRA